MTSSETSRDRRTRRLRGAVATAQSAPRLMRPRSTTPKAVIIPTYSFESDDDTSPDDSVPSWAGSARSSLASGNLTSEGAPTSSSSGNPKTRKDGNYQRGVNFLQLPGVPNIMEGERPPHEQDDGEKIPMRARSQSWLIRARHVIREDRSRTPLISHALFALSVFFLMLTFPFCLFFCFKVAKEYERAVVFRLGRLIENGTKGPGLFFIMPFIDTYRMVDLRVISFDVPPQEILSKDTVTVSVDAVVYFRVSNPVISVTNVNDAQFSTKLLAQTTLRNVLGTKTLSDILSERDAIASVTEKVLDEGTDPWGVKVERVEVKDIRLPHMLMRSMATEAESARDARANVIAAEGEKLASKSLMEAAEVIGSGAALQLRYLQTLVHISAEHNDTFIVPYPVEFLRWLKRRKKKKQ